MDITKDCFTVSKKFRNDIKKFFTDIINGSELNLLEVGSYKGYTTQFLGEIFNRVTSLENNEAHLKYCREHNKHPNVEYLNFDIYSDKWIFENYDVVFIDCDHSEKGVRKDIENSIKIKQVRYLIFDDYVYDSVKDTVNEYIKRGILVKEKFIGLTKNIPCGSLGSKNGKEGIICRVQHNKIEKIEKVEINNWYDWVTKDKNKKMTVSEAIHPTGTNEKDYFISGYVDAYNLMREMEFPYKKKILEFGCGNGRIMRHLNNFDCDGVDLVPEFVKSSKELNLNVFELQDLKKVEEYDIVFSFTVFIHLKKHEAREALKYINKVLKKNGKAYIQAPIYQSNRTGVSFIDINTFDEKTFVQMVEEEGFKVIQLFKNDGHFDYNNFGINHDRLQIIEKV